jgi:hypothetical protein
MIQIGLSAQRPNNNVRKVAGRSVEVAIGPGKRRNQVKFLAKAESALEHEKPWIVLTKFQPNQRPSRQQIISVERQNHLQGWFVRTSRMFSTMFPSDEVALICLGNLMPAEFR